MTATRRLVLGSPWTRATFTPDERAAVEAAIPAGHRIKVTADGSADRFAIHVYCGDEPEATVRPVPKAAVYGVALSLAERLTVRP